MKYQQRIAMQMALEAMGVAHDLSLDEWHSECRETLLDAITALREALAQPQGEPVTCPDKGLWEAQQWGTEKVVLLSDDFEHDVTLVVKGDFVTEDRFRYASQLAAWMNYCLTTPPSVEAAIEEKDHQIATLMCDIEEMYSREDVNHLIGVEREATKEMAAKEVEQWVQIHGVEDIAAAIRSMK